MALTLNTTIDQQKFYSCDFPDLSISTSYGLATISIAVNGSTALHTIYYAVNGLIRVRNLVPVIELAMERLYKAYCTVGIEIYVANETVTASCDVLLCKSRCMETDVESFLTTSFITTNTHRLVTVHEEDVISYFIPGSGQYSVGTFRYDCIVRKADGSIGTYEWVSGRRFAYGIGYTAISIIDIQDTCSRHFGIECQLLSFRLTFGKRMLQYFVVPCASAKSFRFYNVFGCQEAVAFPSATISHLESDFSEALIDGKLMHYDVKHTRTYEEQTAQLLSSHMEWLEQFLTSSSIMYKLPDGMFADVLIKEYSFEQTNAPGEENTLTFTWQFADGRQTTHRYNIHTGIFTEHYNPSFA